MSGSGDPELDAPADGALDLVAFFRGLSAAAGREYEALAAKDLRFGEDVAAERREAGGAEGSGG